MSLDLSWSPHRKADAPTLVKEVTQEVRKHMEWVTTNMKKFENVNFALSEGHMMLQKILCKDCKDAVRSKKAELHSKNAPSYKTKTLRMLPPERLQIVKEITNMLIQLERSRSDNGDEEYCTQEEYHDQKMLEMQNLYEYELENQKSEMKKMEHKYKTEIQDKQAETIDAKKRLQKQRAEIEESNQRYQEQMSRKIKVEGELRELKSEHKRLKADLEKSEKNLKADLEHSERSNRQLKRELDRKDEDIKRYRPSSSSYSSPAYRARTTADNRDDEIRGLKEGLVSKNEELQTANLKIENLKSEHKELVQQIRNLKEDIDKWGKDNSALKVELRSNCDELDSMKAQLQNLQKPKKKEIVMGLCKERSGMGKTMVDMITRELMRRVGGQLDTNNISLTIRPCQTASDIPTGPLVVLCLNMSRIGTNIQDAMEGIQANKDVFVLVLHHTSKENLSSLTPTSLRVTGSELRQLGGIIDMAFSSDGGLYECDLNDSAVEKITSITRKY